MMDFEKEELERNIAIARHEFGHYIVARKLGFETGNVTISSKSTFSGAAGTAEITLHSPITCLDTAIEYCEKRVQVLMAGALAEAMNGASIDDDAANNYLNTSASNDYAKIRELILLYRNISHPETISHEDINSELKNIMDRLWEETKSILIEHKPIIDILSQELAERQTFKSGGTFTKIELDADLRILEALGR